MAFSEIVNPAGRPTLLANLEQLNLLTSVWVGTQADTQSLLNLVGGGTILLWSNNVQGFPPVFVLVKQGDHYYLSFGGTDSKLHWVLNVLGAVLIVPGQVNVFRHGGFWNGWRTLRTLVYDQLPAFDANFRITVTGHSYGGAMAQLAGIDLATDFTRARVETMTWGQPKALTSGYDGPLPSPYLRIVRTADPVPWVPPGALSPARVLSGQFPLFTPATYGLWQHYGSGWELQDDGSLVTDPGEYFGGWLQLFRINQLKVSVHLIMAILRTVVNGIVSGKV